MGMGLAGMGGLIAMVLEWTAFGISLPMSQDRRLEQRRLISSALNLWPASTGGHAAARAADYWGAQGHG
jgi:hypothetical protein